MRPWGGSPSDWKRRRVMARAAATAKRPQDGHPQVGGSSAGQAVPSAPGRLPQLPVTFFAVVVGVAGTAVAWQRAAEVTGRLHVAGTFLSWSTVVLYGVIGLAYLAKAVRYPAAVRAEWRDPVKVAFLPLTSVGLILIALAVVADAPRLSWMAWVQARWL